MGSDVEREEAGVDMDGVGVWDDKDDDDVAGGAVEFKHRLQTSFW